MKSRACKPPVLARGAAPTPPGVQQDLPFPQAEPSARAGEQRACRHALAATPVERLWFCIWLPHLPLEANRSSEAATAIVEEQHGIHRILLADAEATAAGVMPGQAANAALALLPTLLIEERSLLGEQQALEGLATWLERFSSFVCIADRDVLLLEIAGSLRSAGARFVSSRMQTRRPERASQVAANGVGALENKPVHPSSLISLEIFCRSSRNPPNRRRLPAISSSNTSRSAIQTNDEKRSSQVASRSSACCSPGKLRSSSSSVGNNARAAFAACPGMTPAAFASASANRIRWIPCCSSTMAVAASDERFASSGRCGNHIQNQSRSTGTAAGARL